jgi:hypothetical protein
MRIAFVQDKIQFAVPMGVAMIAGNFSKTKAGKISLVRDKVFIFYLFYHYVSLHLV